MNQVAKKTEAAEISTEVGGDPVLSLLERVILMPEMPIERVNALMDMQERQMNKVAEQQFNASFAQAMAEMPSAPQSGLNKHTSQKYSTLDDLVKTSRPVLSKHGLALNWKTEIADGVMTVTAIVRHEGGWREENSKSAPVDAGKGQGASMNTIQAQGSTETYLKRYTGFGILGMSSEDFDDDAHSTGKPTQKSQKYSWAQTVVQDMPENATPREKAEAIGNAIIASFKRRPSVGQLDNEWDRRDALIEDLKAKHNDIWASVCEQYDIHRVTLQDAASGAG